MVIYSRHIVLEREVQAGYIELADGRIKAIHQSWDGPFADYGELVIFPGFMDIHIY